MSNESATNGLQQGDDKAGPSAKAGLSRESWESGGTPLLAAADGEGAMANADAAYVSEGEMKARLQEVKSHYHHGSVSAGTVDELERHADSRLRWVEDSSFSGLVAAVICMDMMLLWYETDQPEGRWMPVNVSFLAFFFAEFALRLLHYRSISILCKWHTSAYRWIAYDGFVVLLALLDAAVTSVGGPVRHRQLGGRAHPSAILRALQLSRLLRLVRIIRMNAALHDFVRLLMEMLQTFAWILSIMFLILFVTAIILTRLIGHGLVVHTDDPELLQELQTMFISIPTTLFTLFQLTTADDWARIAMPLVAVNPWWRLFFIFFITIMSWTMLSLLTAVASETMITESRKQKEVDMKIQSLENRGVVTYLCEKFVQADLDKTNTLDKEEFIKLMSEEGMRQKLKDHGMHFDERDIEKYWKTFDIDDSGELTIDELVHGFSVLQEGLETKHMAKIGYALKSFHHNVETDFEGMQGSIDQLAAQQDEVLKRLLVQQERYKTRWTTSCHQKPDNGEAAVGARATDSRLTFA